MIEVCTVDPFYLRILYLCIYPVAKINVWTQNEHLFRVIFGYACVQRVETLSCPEYMFPGRLTQGSFLLCSALSCQHKPHSRPLKPVVFVFCGLKWPQVWCWGPSGILSTWGLRCACQRKRVWGELCPGMSSCCELGITEPTTCMKWGVFKQKLMWTAWAVCVSWAHALNRGVPDPDNWGTLTCPPRSLGLCSPHCAGYRRALLPLRRPGACCQPLPYTGFCTCVRGDTGLSFLFILSLWGSGFRVTLPQEMVEKCLFLVPGGICVRQLLLLL